MGYRYLHTIGLDATVPDDALVSVFVDEGYVQKRAADLQIGDALVIRSEHVKRDLQQIEPYLEMSALYRSSIENLFVTNRAGMRVPRFRIHLLESVIENSKERSAEILREGADISTQEYSQHAQNIASHVSVCKQAVRYWLKGEALSPREWSEFHNLRALNPIFEEWAQSQNTGEGYHRAWRIYTGLRNSLMTSLTKRCKEGTDKSVRTEGFMAEDIRHIQERFFKELSMTLAVSRILQISDREGTPPNISEDIPTGKIEGGQYHDMNHIRDNFLITERILWEALGNHYAPQDNASQKQIKGFSHLIHLSRFEKREPFVVGNSDDACLDRKLFDGTIDKDNQYPEGTTASIVDRVNMLRSALPERYFLASSQNSEMGKCKQDLHTATDRTKRREIRNKIERLSEKLSRNWQYLRAEYALAPTSIQMPRIGDRRSAEWAKAMLATQMDAEANKLPSKENLLVAVHH